MDLDPAAPARSGVKARKGL